MLQTKEIEALFRTYYRPLCLYALHYLDDPDAVEDVVQESYTALWRQENPVANVRAWLYSAVRNRSIDALRKSGKTEPLPSDLDGPISDDEGRSGPHRRPACGLPWTPCLKCGANASFWRSGTACPTRR